MNFVPIPKNASMAVCEALGLPHEHARASEIDEPRWAIVRNPYDRARSAYAFARTHHSRRARECLSDAETFADFLRLPDNTLTLSQSWWLDADAELIRFEELSVEFAGRFGRSLHVSNASSGKVDHDPDTRALVRDRYAEDFKRFGYVA